jgi:hypothetical protein
MSGCFGKVPTPNLIGLYCLEVCRFLITPDANLTEMVVWGLEGLQTQFISGMEETF